MELQPLATTIKAMAGIRDEITRANRGQLLPLYTDAKRRLLNGEICPANAPCDSCENVPFEHRKCVDFVLKAGFGLPPGVPKELGQ